MSSNRVKLSVCTLVSLFAGYSEATCVNWENTSIPESTPASNYTILPDGTLTAPATGLMWKRCLEGQTLVDGICEGTLIIHNWADALAAAEAVTFAGHSDWRLANPKEMLSIFEDRCAYPALNAELFPIYDFFASWTATPVDGSLQDIYISVWVMDNDGGMKPQGRGSFLPMLLVRDLPES